MSPLNEPLALSAPLARRNAPRLCTRDPLTGESCAWNHGFWQYLRLLDVTTTPQHHARFFEDGFAAATAPGRALRVLVSGAADYSILAHVLSSCDAHGIAADVTVVDICDTPLFLNRWYAEHAGVRVAVHRCDILDYRPGTEFDVVCSHSFLGQFAPGPRTRLVARWRELLRPGGTVLTVNRVRPGAGEARLGFSVEQAREFRALVLREAEAKRSVTGVDPAELAQAAEVYAARQSAFPVRSCGELRELFETGGLEIVELASGPVTDAVGTRVSGPTTPGSADYARLIARRA